MNKQKLTQIPIHLILIFLCFLVFFPVIWMLSTSLKMPDELFTTDLRLIPKNPTLSNYINVWSSYPLVIWFINTSAITVGITLGQLFFGLLAAFAFVRFEFPGKNFLFSAVVGTLIIPFTVTMVPNYILISSLNLNNTWWGVILPYLPAGLATFLLRQFMRTLPQDLFDAAQIDGANSWKILWLIVVPNIRAGIVVVTIIVSITAWNIYFWPFLVLTEPSVKTLAIGLRAFMDEEAGYQWGELMAASFLATVAPLIIYFIIQRHVISAFTRSGMKG